MVDGEYRIRVKGLGDNQPEFVTSITHRDMNGSTNIGYVFEFYQVFGILAPITPLRVRNAAVVATEAQRDDYQEPTSDTPARWV